MLRKSAAILAATVVVDAALGSAHASAAWRAGWWDWRPAWGLGRAVDLDRWPHPGNPYAYTRFPNPYVYPRAYAGYPYYTGCHPWRRTLFPWGWRWFCG